MCLFFVLKIFLFSNNYAYYSIWYYEKLKFSVKKQLLNYACTNMLLWLNGSLLIIAYVCGSLISTIRREHLSFVLIMQNLICSGLWISVGCREMKYLFHQFECSANIVYFLPSLNMYQCCFAYARMKYFLKATSYHKWLVLLRPRCFSILFYPCKK